MNKTEKRMKIFTLIMQVIIQAVLLFPWMNMGTWKCNVPEYLIKLAASGDGMSYIKKSLKPLGVLDGADEQMMVQILMLFICELVMVLVIQVIGIVNLILALSNHHKLLLDIISWGRWGSIFRSAVTGVSIFTGSASGDQFDRCEAD